MFQLQRLDETFCLCSRQIEDVIHHWRSHRKDTLSRFPPHLVQKDERVSLSDARFVDLSVALGLRCSECFVLLLEEQKSSGRQQGESSHR